MTLQIIQMSLPIIFNFLLSSYIFSFYIYLYMIHHFILKLNISPRYFFTNCHKIITTNIIRNIISQSNFKNIKREKILFNQTRIVITLKIYFNEIFHFDSEQRLGDSFFLSERVNQTWPRPSFEPVITCLLVLDIKLFSRHCDTLLEKHTSRWLPIQTQSAVRRKIRVILKA